ncbi:hypothetical protein OG935_25395 [Nocardia cyriacigeorgica]|uniref:hypothetical protein n=1 Tax=Nocardia cyriacigeorgica TaxID=135487 RepID=UPI0018939B9C|nr:hypothetical protein [Nocardia cyriacigeorgica]MBF6321568.1 hypothetical protein [Nocardia cyriacigeorgica]MBF6494754.1 hypothetical protein [Nocardia cyriacigeorgica]
MFEDFVRFAELPDVVVPSGSGVYVVVRPTGPPPVFLPASPGGWCRGPDRDPSLPVTELVDAWVPGEPVLYIGKSDARPSGRRGLRRRLSEYRRHSAGRPARHWGGRMIWQLADSSKLLVAWRLVDQPRVVERSMIAEFTALRGKQPFANRT